MKYLVALIFFVSLLCPDICMAADAVKGKTAAKTAVMDANSDDEPKVVDLGDSDEYAPEDYGVDEPGTPAPWQTFDENTGLQDAVPSDSEYNLE